MNSTVGARQYGHPGSYTGGTPATVVVVEQTGELDEVVEPVSLQPGNPQLGIEAVLPVPPVLPVEPLGGVLPVEPLGGAP